LLADWEGLVEEHEAEDKIYKGIWGADFGEVGAKYVFEVVVGVDVRA